MKIIPAIDIQNGNCVRLKQGDFTKETIFHSSPIDMAQKWVDEGAERLHIVDLDGARLGSPINMAVISKICDKFPSIPVQIGGGIRDLETAEKYLSAGASFIIVGTKAVEDPNFIKILCSKFPKKVIVGIDAKNGEVATEGWLSISDKNAIDFAKIFENLGVAEIVYTDIEKDGMMKGLNIEATLDLAKILFYITPNFHFITSIFILNKYLEIEKIVAFIIIWIGVSIFIYDAVKSPRLS